MRCSLIQVLIVALYDLKAQLRDWKAFMLKLLLPWFFILLVGYGLAPRLNSNSYLEPFAVAVVDQENSVETRALVQHLATTPAMKGLVTVHKVPGEQASAMLRQGEVAAVITIPERFVWQMARGENLPFTVVGNPRRPLQTALIRHLMQSGADLVSASQSGVNTVMHYMAEADLSSKELDHWYGESVTEFGLQALGRNRLFRVETVSSTGAASPLLYYAISLGLLSALLTGLAGLWAFRDEGAAMLGRLRSSGLTHWQLLLARWLGLVLLQLIQLAITFALIALLLPMAFTGSLPLVGAVLIATALANAALLVLAATVAPDGASANLIALAAVALLALIGGAIVPSAFLPGPLRQIEGVSLYKWSIEGLLTALFSDGSVLKPLAALLGLTALKLGVATTWLRVRGAAE